jgi:hypothetical protein
LYYFGKTDEAFLVKNVTKRPFLLGKAFFFMCAEIDSKNRKEEKVQGGVGWC